MNLLIPPQDALPWAPATTCALVLWAVLMHTAWRHSQGTRWLPQLPQALLAGAVTALLALQWLPPGPPPGLAEWGYALPAPRLARLASVAGLVATLWTWPLLALRQALRQP
jgi:hypothetical protein